MLKININFHLSKPIYFQIVDEIKKNIATGNIKENDKLPSVRELALTLKINPNTVAKAYKMLIDDKICQSVPKKGIYISKKGITKSDIESLQIKFEKIFIEAKTKNVDKKELNEIFKNLFNKYYN